MAVKKKESFETALKRLEEIVKQLESGDAPLEASMALFEEGSRLSATLSRQLDEAEQKVSVMLRGENGALNEESFAQEDA